MAGRRKRKRRQRAPRTGNPTSAETASGAPPTAAATHRRSSKDDLAREQLVPLREGERPLAITIGAGISGLLGLTTIVLFAAGVDAGKADFSGGATILYAALMLLMAWGMWNVRYWAVLGFQALLALLIVIWSLLLVKAETVLAALIAVVVIGLAGALFWFLVKSLARVQMPDRRS
jgi:hypothetical protein